MVRCAYWIWIEFGVDSKIYDKGRNWKETGTFISVFEDALHTKIRILSLNTFLAFSAIFRIRNIRNFKLVLHFLLQPLEQYIVFISLYKSSLETGVICGGLTPK